MSSEEEWRRLAELDEELLRWRDSAALAQALGGGEGEWEREVFRREIGPPPGPAALDALDLRFASAARNARSEAELGSLRARALVVERSPAPFLEYTTSRPATLQVGLRLLGGRSLWAEAAGGAGGSVAVLPEGLAQLRLHNSADTLRSASPPVDHLHLISLIESQPSPWSFSDKAKSPPPSIRDSALSVQFREESFTFGCELFARLVAEVNVPIFGRPSDAKAFAGKHVNWIKPGTYPCPFRHFYVWARFDRAEAFSLPSVLVSNYKKQAVDEGGEAQLLGTLLFYQGQLPPRPTLSSGALDTWERIAEARVSHAPRRPPHALVASLLGLKLSCFKPSKRGPQRGLDQQSRLHLARKLETMAGGEAGTSWAHFTAKSFVSGRLEDGARDEPFSFHHWLWDFLLAVYTGAGSEGMPALWNSGLVYGLASRASVAEAIRQSPCPGRVVVFRLSDSSRRATVAITRPAPGQPFDGSRELEMEYCLASLSHLLHYSAKLPKRVTHVLDRHGDERPLEEVTALLRSREAQPAASATAGYPSLEEGGGRPYQHPRTVLFESEESPVPDVPEPERASDWPGRGEVRLEELLNSLYLGLGQLRLQGLSVGERAELGRLAGPLDSLVARLASSLGRGRAEDVEHLPLSGHPAPPSLQPLEAQAHASQAPPSDQQVLHPLCQYMGSSDMEIIDSAWE